MTIIISDLHLGAPISQVKQLTPKLEAKLETGQVKRLILNGDIFQDLNFERLTKHHWKFISLIRKWSDKIEIIWIFGNHDAGIIDVMQHLVGVKVYDYYEWIENDKKHCVIHGHQFDSFIGQHKITSRFFSNLYIQLQKIPIIKTLIIKLVNLGDIKFSRSVNKVRNGAIQFAKNNKIDIIICGHTHKSEMIEIDEIIYANSGGWIGDIGTIIEIDNSIMVYEFRIAE
ncbi:MAG: UDP-2,3-diacylglucosamine hydrolase [Ignavibacteriaceae bacterium]|nr:MAG: UDP-2,3-diacylglucosamine hydrolase [Ignavibacteriaceae bacterium]